MKDAYAFPLRTLDRVAMNVDRVIIFSEQTTPVSKPSAATNKNHLT